MAEAGNDADAPSVSRRLGVGSLYVLLGSLFTLLVGLPLQIYVSRVLGPGGLGVYGLLETAVGTAAGLLGLGIGQTATRFIPAHVARGEHAQAFGLVRLGGTILLVVGASAYILVLLSLPWIGDLRAEVASYRGEIAVMALMIPIGLLTYFMQQSLRGFHEIRHIVLGLSVMQLLVKAVLTVAVFAAGLALGGYILATLVGAVFGLGWLLYNLNRRIRSLPAARPSYEQLADWRSYAVVTFSGALIGQLAWGLDRFLLGAFAGASAVGIWLVAVQLQNLPERFNQMLLMVGAPLMSAAHARGDLAERQHIYWLMTDWSVRCSLPLVLFLFFFAGNVLSLYGPEFADSGTLPLRLLVAVQFVGLVFGPVGGIAVMSGLERTFFIVSVTETALAAALLLILIWYFGLIGAAVAISARTLFLKTAIMALVKWKLRLRWWDRRYAAWLPQAGAGAALCLLALYLRPDIGSVGLLATLGGMYLLALAVNLVLGLHADDRELLGHMRKRLFGT